MGNQIEPSLVYDTLSPYHESSFHYEKSGYTEISVRIIALIQYNGHDCT